jgi:hypothetical protein
VNGKAPFLKETFALSWRLVRRPVSNCFFWLGEVKDSLIYKFMFSEVQIFQAVMLSEL